MTRDPHSPHLELAPAILLHHGLRIALQLLVSHVTETRTLSIDLDAEIDAEPDGLTRRVLLFEGVRQIVLPAVEQPSVQHVEIHLGRAPSGAMRLVVAIDSSHITSDACAKMLFAMGLCSLRQRLRLWDGEIDVEEAACQIQITIVLPNCLRRTSAPPQTDVEQALTNLFGWGKAGNPRS